MKTSIIRRTAIIFLWLALWEILSLVIDNDIIIVGPIKVIKAFIGNIFYADFIKTVLYSTFKIGMGFVCALLTGLILGSLAYRYRLFSELLSPVVSVLKTIPVASFVVLLLIWAGAGKLSCIISFIIAFPIIYAAVLTGLSKTDEKLVEMARAYNASFMKKAAYIYRPGISPYLQNGIKVAVGLSFKSGVAAEVIGMSRFSIGERIYMSKVYLDTAGLLSWTLLVILISFVFEKIFLYLAGIVLDGYVPVKNGNRNPLNENLTSLQIDNLTINKEGKTILSNFTFTFNKGRIYCVMAPSGSGKTTLLKEIFANSRGSMTYMFQEDRLLERLTGQDNILFGESYREGNGSLKYIELLKKLIPNAEPEQSVSTYSGGMKRRLAFVRALSHNGNILLLDEPFTGIDDEKKRMMTDLLLGMKEDKIIIIATHDVKDAEYLNAEIIRL